MNVLIVDDLFQNRKLLSDILKPYGRCDTVSDGYDAIDAFDAALEDGNPYDLVLLDIVMPEFDGQAVLKAIRSIEIKNQVSRKSVIIMVTSLCSPNDLLRAFHQGGCDDYIVKPINREDLIYSLGKYDLIKQC